MSIPEKLSRPLASRIGGLPDVTRDNANPEISQAVINAAIQALDDGKTHYTDRPGILPLRQWVCDHLRNHFGVELSPDAVTITCGRSEARFVTIKVLAQPDTQIYCPGDSTAIKGMAHLAGATITDSVDKPDSIRLAYLTPRDGKAALEQAVELTRQHDWWLAWDMVSGREDFHPAQTADIAHRVITLGSLSDRLPGWRIGWLAGSEMAGKLRAYKQSMTICSTSVSQWAALGLVESL
jgi:aspartate/methionine/tyrosine aminotransferase